MTTFTASTIRQFLPLRFLSVADVYFFMNYFLEKYHGLDTHAKRMAALDNGIECNQIIDSLKAELIISANGTVCLKQDLLQCNAEYYASEERNSFALAQTIMSVYKSGLDFTIPTCPLNANRVLAPVKLPRSEQVYEFVDIANVLTTTRRDPAHLLDRELQLDDLMFIEALADLYWLKQVRHISSLNNKAEQQAELENLENRVKGCLAIIKEKTKHLKTELKNAKKAKQAFMKAHPTASHPFIKIREMMAQMRAIDLLIRHNIQERQFLKGFYNSFVGVLGLMGVVMTPAIIAINVLLPPLFCGLIMGGAMLGVVAITASLMFGISSLTNYSYSNIADLNVGSAVIKADLDLALLKEKETIYNAAKKHYTALGKQISDLGKKLFPSAPNNTDKPASPALPKVSSSIHALLPPRTPPAAPKSVEKEVSELAPPRAFGV